MVRILGVAAVVAVLVQSGSVSIDCKELIRQFDRPIMMVELNGENRPALLDTGASLASIPENEHANWLKELPRAVQRVRRIDGLKDEMVYGPKKLRLFGTTDITTTFTRTAPVAELNSFLDQIVVGADCLKMEVVRIHSRDGIVQNHVQSLVSTEAVSLFEEGDNLPSVVVQLPLFDGRRIRLDTGSDGWLSLKQRWIDMLVRSDDVVLLETRQMKVPSGIVKTEVYCLRYVDFAGVRFHNVPVIPSEAETIGMAMLQHFDFTLDFPNRRAKFTPLDVNRDQMPVDASGLRVVFRGPDNLVVRRLVPGYPAEKAGFKVGDRILDFHGRKPETLWRYEIDELLSQAGETLQFVIEREGQQMTLPLTLRRPFEYPPKWAPETPEFDPNAPAASDSSQN